MSYSVKLETGRVRKCHIDQLRERTVEVQTYSTPVVVPPVEIPVIAPSVPESVETHSPEAPTSQGDTPSVGDNQNMMEQNEEVRVNPQLNTPKEYPKRNRTQVQKYDPSFK